MRARLYYALLASGFAAAFLACVGDTTVNPNDGGTDATSPDSSTADAPADVSAEGPSDASAPWTPAQLDTAGSLALWLDTDTDPQSNIVVSSGRIETWKDLSKNHNDAIDASGGPTLSTAAVNGLDAVHFGTHGVVLTIADAPSLQFSNDQIYMVAVTRVATTGLYFFSKVTTGPSGNGAIFKTGYEFYEESTPTDAGNELDPAVHFAEDPTDSGTPTNYGATWGGGPFADGKFHMVAVRRPTPGTIVLSVDDQAPQPTATGGYSISEVGRDVEIGSVKYGSFSPPMDCDIAELVVLHATVIADSDVANLRAYLKAKYNL